MNDEHFNATFLHGIPKFIPRGLRVFTAGNAFIDEFANVGPATICGVLAEIAKLGVRRLLIGADAGVDCNLIRHCAVPRAFGLFRKMCGSTDQQVNLESR